MSIEKKIKNQYATVFRAKDSPAFKLMAEMYYRRASTLRKKDIDLPKSYRLIGRNAQKRLDIGIATELLMKSILLKEDYCINKLSIIPRQNWTTS